jgi:hypothetical protein
MPVLRPRLKQQFILCEVLQRFHGPLAALGEQWPPVSAIGPHTPHVRHQLPQRHGPLLLRKLRDVGLNLVVQCQPTPLQKHAGGGGSEHSGGRSDPEPGIRRHGHARLDVRPAKAFGPHHAAAHADRYR